MNETILQAYLNEQHIKTDVKENIEALTKAVNEVKKQLTRKNLKVDIIPFTLVALDPMVAGTDPVVLRVEEIIIKNWPAFKNSVTATKDKSTTYIRAVILESLSQLSKADAATAALAPAGARLSENSKKTRSRAGCAPAGAMLSENFKKSSARAQAAPPLARCCQKTLKKAPLARRLRLAWPITLGFAHRADALLPNPNHRPCSATRLLQQRKICIAKKPAAIRSKVRP